MSYEAAKRLREETLNLIDDPNRDRADEYYAGGYHQSWVDPAYRSTGVPTEPDDFIYLQRWWEGFIDGLGEQGYDFEIIREEVKSSRPWLRL